MSQPSSPEGTIPFPDFVSERSSSSSFEDLASYATTTSQSSSRRDTLSSRSVELEATSSAWATESTTSSAEWVTLFPRPTARRSTWSHPRDAVSAPFTRDSNPAFHASCPELGTSSLQETFENDSPSSEEQEEEDPYNPYDDDPLPQASTETAPQIANFLNTIADDTHTLNTHITEVVLELGKAQDAYIRGVCALPKSVPVASDPDLELLDECIRKIEKLLGVMREHLCAIKAHDISFEKELREEGGEDPMGTAGVVDKWMRKYSKMMAKYTEEEERLHGEIEGDEDEDEDVVESVETDIVENLESVVGVESVTEPLEKTKTETNAVETFESIELSIVGALENIQMGVVEKSEADGVKTV